MSAAAPSPADRIRAVATGDLVPSADYVAETTERLRDLARRLTPNLADTYIAGALTEAVAGAIEALASGDDAQLRRVLRVAAETVLAQQDAGVR